MPIEIRELIIRARIEEDTGQDEVQRDVENSSREELIEDCVEQVLRIIERKKER